MTTIEFRLADEPTYEAGAKLLTVLVWPNMIDDHNEMAKHHACLCQAYLRNRAEADLDWALTPQSIKPLYWSRPLNLMDGIYRECQRRISERLIAGKMAVPFLREALGVPVNLPAGVSRLSLNALSAFVLPDTEKPGARHADDGKFDANNVEARIWRLSRPVIHVAAALAVVLDGLEKKGERCSVADVFEGEDLIRDTVTRSEKYAKLIPKIERFVIDPDSLIRLRLV